MKATLKLFGCQELENHQSDIIRIYLGLCRMKQNRTENMLSIIKNETVDS